MKSRFVARLLLFTFGLESTVFAQAPPTPAGTDAAAWGHVHGAPSARHVHGRPSGGDLRDWTQEGEPGNGTWLVSPDGTSVVQAIEGGPSFFVSPQGHINTTLRGRLSVAGRGEGSIGFLLGYRSPLAANGDDPARHDFLLFEWRSVPFEGFALARVQAAIAGADPAVGPGVDVLARREGTGLGLLPGKDHRFEIVYRRSRIRVVIDGKAILDVTGSFPRGRFGFYTHSQKDVRFSGLTAEPANAPPVADAGEEQTVEVNATCQTEVRLDGSRSSDPDGDVLTYAWTGPFGIAVGPKATVSLDAGVHSLTLTVDDGSGEATSDTVEVIMEDRDGRCRADTTASPATTAPVTLSTGPAASASLMKTLLSPPNHKLVDVGLTVVASDPSGTLPAVNVAVFADEPDDHQTGDGNQWPDAKLEPTRLWLRSERRGDADGRVYLLLLTATNGGGESAHACRTVVIPHDSSQGSIESVNAQASAARAFCEANAGAPSEYFPIADGPYTPTPPTKPVMPILECVTQSGGATMAVFGYDNQNPVPVTIGLGVDNAVSPAPADRGQPTMFRPGRTPATGAFSVPVSGTLTWILKGPDGVTRAATASQASPSCTTPPATPDAGDDAATTPKATPVTVAVLANDTDPQGDVLTVIRVTPPGQGSAILNADGTVTYTPNPSFVGIDAFTYTVGDGGFGTDQATVTVTVTSANGPPTVDAGPDQSITLPASTVTLMGTATDDGVPAPLTVSWSQVSGPAAVTFGSPNSVVTSAAFAAAGTYVLRLTASDSELSASDGVTVTVLPPSLPSVSVADAALVEGNGGTSEAEVAVTLSEPSAQTVSVDYVTSDRTASSLCDYLPRFGTLTFAPGETRRNVKVPLVGDLAAEGDETVAVLIGNAVKATLGRAEGLVTIGDDDAPNAPPTSPGDRAPADLSTGIGLDPVLTWSAMDPDGDALTYDVFFGTSFGTTGQAWTRLCAAGPGPRAGAATAYDDATDRLIVFGGEAGSSDLADVWVLANATGAGGAPVWTRLATSGEPAPRSGASAAYDPATNRLVVYGGAAVNRGTGTSTAFADAWVLTNANGLGGAPEWIALPEAPVARAGHIASYDAGSNRLIVFGGRSATDLNDVWLLKDANGIGNPAWEQLQPTGATPSLRSGMAGTYDPASNRLIVFGGRDTTDTVFGDVWVLSNANGLGGTPAWTRLEPIGTPPAPRWGHAAAYDAASRRLIVFGGSGPGFEAGSNVVASDAWMLTNADGLAGTPEWVRITPEGALPTGRILAASAFSASQNRLVVALGMNNRTSPARLSDLWVMKDAAGSLPRVSQGQAQTTYATTTPAASATYYWRVVARDVRGATAGSLVWRFRPNGEPSVEAGADQTITLPANTVPLNGSATDDGLPNGTLTLAWRQVSGAGRVTFTDTAAASTTATFDAGGTYVLRLTGSDGELSASDTVTVTVRPRNDPPVVDAGPDRTISLPATTVALNGSVTDDGQPSGTVRVAWTKVSGPGGVTFTDTAAASTTAAFDAAGTYVLRLTGSDTELMAQDDVTVTVLLPNRPPAVTAGPDQATTLPAATVTLGGSVTDDGLPGGSLTVFWTKVSGPGNVAFGRADAASTTATFDAAGVYVLRLTASDGEITASDEAAAVVASPSLLPDLTVPQVDASALTVDPEILEMSGAVAALVTNIGQGPAAGPFAIAFFEDMNASQAYEPGADTLLGTASLTGLGAGDSAAVSVTVAGTALFRGNLVYAFVDSETVVAEASEANNTGSSAPACAYEPPRRAWNVTQEWAWTRTGVAADSTKVVMAPVVVDLTGDGVPEVVFVSYWRGDSIGYSLDGRLRALSGRDGAEVFTVTDPAYDLTGGGQIAAADIDGDGRPEILAVSEGSGDRILAFEHDGTFKWKSPLLERIEWGGPSVADLDGDGVPEIVIGRQVLNADGSLRWTGTGGRGNNVIRGASSIVVDLDLDGRPEVVGGNTAYIASGGRAGQILWRQSGTYGGVAVGDGYTGAANFDGDPYPEIVLVSAGYLWLLEHTGEVKWGPVALGSPNVRPFGGPPSIGDVDGDGQVEIAVAGYSRFAVYEADGSLKWTAPIVETTSSTGSALFDFDGDGALEIVYADELALRIYRGADGLILFETPVDKSTGQESPVVADVDGDGKAEIVIGSDGITSSGVDPARRVPPGVRVFGDASDTWTQARAIWNQYDYRITNVNDDGTIPRNEARSQAFNAYRSNAAAKVEGGVVTPRCAYAKPDLTASRFRLAAAGGSRVLTVRIGNGGAAVTGPNVPVSFYDGEPSLGGPRLGTVRTSRLLPPGRYEDVSLTLPASLTTRASVWVVADDFGGGRGAVTESDEANNAYDTGLALLAGSGQADLLVEAVDTGSLGGNWQTLEVSGSVSAEVRNQGEAAAAAPFVVSVFEDRNGSGGYEEGQDALLGTAVLDGLPAGARATLTAAVSGSVLFKGAPVHVFADSGGVVAEADETNNVGRSGRACSAKPPPGPFAPQVEWKWTASTVLGASTSVASTPVVADLDGDRVPDVVFVTFAGTSVGGDGHLRATSGRDGREIFTVTGSAHDVAGWGNVAVGDIDGDGKPEIVAIHESGLRLIAFEHDGSFKWLSPSLEGFGLGGVSLADLDGDGKGEVVIGRHVLRGADGTVVWSGTAESRGQNAGLGPFSVVADLDMDGSPEVLAGNAAYRAGGTVLWRNAALPDGYNAVGNFDTDPYPEIVLVSDNRAWLLEHDGTVKWGPVVLPGQGYASPPVVADVDGDGAPEIGVGMRTRYSLVETTGLVRWSVATDQATTLWNIGVVASAFDFDGDGASELLLSDESGLKVLRGRDGATLAQVAVETCNVGWSYPLVADVDADGNAEIVVGANRYCTGSATAGLYVIGDANDNWVSARKVWNQHAYAVSAVNDDATLPRQAKASWLETNAFRASALMVGSPFASPDLTASYVRRSNEGTDLRFTARVGNGGAGVAPRGVKVAFYNGDPRRGFARFGAASTSRGLVAGEYEDVSLTVPSSLPAEEAVVVVADDPSTQRECDEANNLHVSDQYLNRAPVVGAGVDQSIIQPATTVSLSGSVTDDGLPLGQTLGVRWTYVAGPIDPGQNPQLFADPTSPVTTATLGQVGVYLLRLTASDGARGSADDVVVTVYPANEPPSVSAGPDQTTGLPADTVALDGTVTDDGMPPGSSLTIAWTQVSGPAPVGFGSPATAATTASFTQAGVYVLRLTATDGEASRSDDVSVTVDPVNQPPTVNAGPDQRVTTTTATLNGVATDDGLPRGGTLTIAWTTVSGPGTVAFANPAQPTTTASFSAEGEYVLRLSASDGALSAFDDVSVRYNPANEPPAVNAGPDQSITTAATTLAGTVTDDGLPAGSTLTIAWTQFSGPAPVAFGNPASATTTASFGADGVYVLRLSATDGELSATDDVAVAVARANQPPAVSAGPDQTITLPTDTATLAGTVTDDGLPAGSTVTSRWTQLAGPAPVTFGSPVSPTTAATFTAPGSYLLRLTASDTALTASDDVAVSVQGGTPVGDPPTVAIASPTERQGIASPTPIVGTVTSDSLFLWRLEHRRQGSSTWTTFASGGTPAANQTLGIFDPTLLLNGLYEIRLTAIDTAARTASTSVFVVARDNQKIGNFTVSFVDLEVPVAGLPIRVTRTYDSRDKDVGDFGYGWRVDLSNVKLHENGTAGLSWYGSVFPGFFATYCLQPVKPQVVTITTPDGRVSEYEPVLTPQCQPFQPIQEATLSFRPLPGTLGSLAPMDGGRVLVEASWPGPAQLYGASTFTLYDPDQYRLTLPDGRSLDVDQLRGLKAIRDTNGNTLTVNANGITHSSGKGIAFARDGLGRITTITDPGGNSMTYTYDGSGDLLSFKDRENAVTTFTYNTSHGLMGIEDPRGIQPIRNEYDDAGRLVRHIDAFGKTIEYTHSPGTRQEIITDRLGQVRVLEYDDRGNVVRETHPNGKLVKRTFDPRNNRLTETEPHDPSNATPATTTYTYDASDHLLSATDPLGQRAAYTYNPRGQALTVTDPRGKVTTSVYDPAGNLTSTTDAVGNVTAFTYDARGNVLTQTDALGNVTRYDYDAYGNVTKETSALGHVTTSTYDANGNRLSGTRTRTTSSGTETLTTTHVYDKLGRLTETHDPDGTVTKTTYDALGKQVQATDKLGRTTGFTYDEMGRLTKTTYPDGTSEESTYDAEGRRLTSKDRGGRTTRHEYDALGRLTKTTYPDNTFTTSTYDAAGRIVSSKDARGSITTYEYDAAGRRTKVIDALGNVTASTYDASGNLTSVKDPKGQTTSYEYDDLNRRTKTLFPDGTSATTIYDALGHRVSETDQAGKTTSYAYDALGRLTKVTDEQATITWYSYDEAGNRISQKDANNHETRFEHDKLGRETKRILPQVGSAPPAVETKTYDAAGSLTTRTDFAGRVTSYSYDVGNRLLSRTYPDNSSVSFTYSPTGRRLTATDSRGTTSYAYDLRDRLASLTYPDGRRLAYAHDANGNRSSLTATTGATSVTTTYAYDGAGRLQTVTDPLARAYGFGYDPNGNRASLAYPNGTVTAYTYNALNRLTSLATTHPASGRMVQSYAFTLGPSGNRTQITEADGHVRGYTYDALYRLTGESVTGGLSYSKTWTYDPVGNRLTQTTSGTGAPGTPTAPGTISYTYDERDRLLADSTSYAYDENGNLTTKSGEATYTWDFENRLTKVTKADGTVVEHAYDADSNRVQTKTTPAGGSTTTVNYLVDTSRSLSHVVAETNETGALKAYYVRGDDLLALMRPDGAGGWTSRFYHADGIGSVRRLTNEDGFITDGYTYTAFGELIAHTGTDPQPYAFAGEPYDPNVGFQYHRARWMDPRTGRFASIDPWQGSPLEPRTLHKYLYAHATPVNATDASGLFSSMFFGNVVHGLIGEEFEDSGRGRIYNRGISTIVGDVIPYFGRFRPDLIDTVNKQVYEIKTVRDGPLGLWELEGYILMLNWADPDNSRPWTAGTAENFTAISPRNLGFGFTVFVFPPIQGVITYDVGNPTLAIGGLAAVALASRSTDMARLVNQVATAILLVTIGGF